MRARPAMLALGVLPDWLVVDRPFLAWLVGVPVTLGMMAWQAVLRRLS